MPLGVLIALTLRIVAIAWAVEELAGLAVMIPMLITVWSGPAPFPTYPMTASAFIAPVVILALAALLWAGAGWLGRMAVRGMEREVAFNLTLPDFYRAAFVFVGLYFFFTSLLAATRDFQNLSHFYMVATASHNASDTPQRQAYYNDLLAHALAILLSLGSILGAGRWTALLLGRKNEAETR